MSSTFRRPDPLSLSGNVAENWRLWKQRFNIYLLASDAVGKRDAVKIAMLLNFVGEDALERYNQFSWTEDEDQESFAAVVAKFDEHFKGKKRLVFSRYRFWSHQRSEGQEFVDYYTDLQKLANQCEFEEKENMMRDKLIFSMRDKELKERLLEMDSLTLEHVKAKIMAAEITRKEINQMESDLQERKRIEAVRKQKKKSNAVSFQSKTVAVYKKNCFNCGNKHAPKSCPAYGKECFNCHKRNHFAKFCRGAGKKAGALTKEIQDDQSLSSDDEMFFMGGLSFKEHRSSSDTVWWEKIRINGSVIRFKIDSGAEVNLISKEQWERLGQKVPLKESNAVLQTLNGGKLENMGKAVVEFGIKSANVRDAIYVTRDKTCPILGLKTATQLGLIQRGSNASSKVDAVFKSLTEQEIKEKFGFVFNGELGKYPGSYRIRLTKDANPKINVPRRVPHKLIAPLQRKLEEMVKQGVIEEVEHPTDWVNSIVCTEKKDGSIRLCLDPRELNKYIKREHFTIPTFQEIVAKLGKPRFFTIVDQSSAFWQVELEETCRDLTTFQTNFGRYRFKRMPFGISSASEVLQKKAFQLFGDIRNVHIIADDMLVVGDTEQEHDEALIAVLQRAKENDIKFNMSKLQFKRNEVVYCGTKLAADGIQADSSKVEAILKMPDPENKRDIQRLLGMVNYLSPFIPNKAQVTEPLRILMKEGAVWSWNKAQSDALRAIKSILSSKIMLTYYDETKPVVIQADASHSGLGACLLQNGQPISYASKSLTETEQRWAQIEKELLAIVFATQRFHHFIYGVDVIVHSDHKPLESIQRKDLHKVSPRLQRMLLKLLKYNLNIVYKPGSEMHIADTLSRAFIDVDPKGKDSLKLHVHSVMEHYPASAKKINEYKLSTAKDKTSQLIMMFLKTRWPNRKDIDPKLIPYYDHRHEIYEEDGLLFLSNKLIIPESERDIALQRLHQGHYGIDKTKSFAREIIYWPGMNRQIEETVQRCKVCNKFQRNQVKEPIIQHGIPDTPWLKVGADLFNFAGRDYLIVVDYFSKYPEFVSVLSKSASSVVQAMKIIFARHGIPEIVVADNVPFNSKTFKDFSSSWDFCLVTSSPRYPKSNGEAEKYVGIIKMILRKCKEDGTDPNLALLRYRNMKIKGMMYSPAQMLFNRRLRDNLPIKDSLLKPEITVNVKQQLTDMQFKRAAYYNRNSKVRNEFEKGESVRVKVDTGREWMPAIIDNKHCTPRSYIVTTEKGQIIRRNKSAIKSSHEAVKVNPPYPDKSNSLQAMELPGSIDKRTPIEDTPRDTNSHMQQDGPTSVPRPELRRSKRTIKAPNWQKDYMMGTK